MSNKQQNEAKAQPQSQDNTNQQQCQAEQKKCSLDLKEIIDSALRASKLGPRLAEQKKCSLDLIEITESALRESRISTLFAGQDRPKEEEPEKAKIRGTITFVTKDSPLYQRMKGEK